MGLGVLINNAECQTYVVECVNKRRKLLIQTSLSSCKQKNLFQSLQDELVEEIFCRLPCSKYVIQCKCVCKHWSALIFHPYFVRRFIASKLSCRRPLEDKQMGGRANIIQNGNNFLRFDGSGSGIDKEERFVVVVRGLFREPWNGLIVDLKDPILNPHNSSFCSLPSLIGESATSVVVGACNDLVLCRRDEDCQRYAYYICNFQTRQQLLLPSPQFYHGDKIFEGFICDPYYTYDDGTLGRNVNLNSTYRYSIVVVVPSARKATSKFNAHLFSSINRRWTNIVLSLPRLCNSLGPRSFVFAGMIHLRCREGIIVFDPYKDSKDIMDGTIKCRLVPWPPGLFWGTASIGLRQGRLQLTGYGKSQADARVMSSWVLRDYERGEWSLQHRIAQCDWVPRDPASGRDRDKFEWLGGILCQHPTKPDLIYKHYSHQMFLCNASERTVEVASGVCPESIRVHPSCYSFLLMSKIWPTPLPQLA